MFEQSFVQTTDTGKRTSTIMISFLVQLMVLIVLILIPLIYFDQIQGGQLNSMLVAPAPPPPPPPPPPPQAVKPVKVIPRQMDLNVLRAPKTIPKDVKMIREEELPPPSSGVVGGVAGGVPGGSTGILGGIMGGIGAAPPPPPPKKEAPKGPQRVGGNVMAANLIRQVKPTYPPLARQARISGTVVFSAIISKEGTIENLALVSGHPLLVSAAKEAVSQWVYKPTLLNGEPVEVATTISVNFTLSGQ